MLAVDGGAVTAGSSRREVEERQPKSTPKQTVTTGRIGRRPLSVILMPSRPGPQDGPWQPRRPRIRGLSPEEVGGPPLAFVGMQRWEYKQTVIPGNVAMKANLDEIGAQGWELVSVFMRYVGSWETIFYFKRPVEDPAPR